MKYELTIIPYTMLTSIIEIKEKEVDTLAISMLNLQSSSIPIIMVIDKEGNEEHKGKEASRAPNSPKHIEDHKEDEK